MICLELDGVPIPQARPRFFKKKDFVGAYDAQSNLKAKVKWQLRSQYNGVPFSVPIKIVIFFHMPIPKATSKVKRRQMIGGLISHIHKPDIDNLQKFVLDCLTDLIIEDDSQIIDIHARKVYSEIPHTFINIFPLVDEKRGLICENQA